MNGRCARCGQFVDTAHYEIAQDGRAEAYIRHICPEAPEYQRQTPHSVSLPVERDEPS